MSMIIISSQNIILALIFVPEDGARRPQGWAHLLQGQTLDSHWVEESGRYLLKSAKTTREDGERRSNGAKRIWIR